MLSWLEKTLEFNMEDEYRWSKASYEKFAKLQDECIHSEYKNICINIGKSKYINPAYAVLLGSFNIIGKVSNKKIQVLYDTNNIKNMQLVADLGIHNFYNCKAPPARKEAIPFVQFKNLEGIDERTEEIFKKAPIHITKDAMDVLVSNLYEVFLNAFEHGQDDNGVFCCGGWDTSRKQLIFSIYDLGRGIPKSVNSYLKNADTKKYNEIKGNDKFALQWALQAGNSSLNFAENSKGLGLSLLADFAKINNGKLYICSGYGFCEVTSKNTKFSNIKFPLKGTIFTMSILADENRIYVL